MVTSLAVTVSTTAVDLLSGIDTDRPLEVFVCGGNVYLGGPDVTTANGFQCGSNPLRIDLHGDTLYAVAGSTTTVKVLVVSVR